MRNEVMLGGSKPKGSEVEDPEIHLLVDGLLSRTGVTNRRYISVDVAGDIRSEEGANEALGPFVTAVRESAVVLEQKLTAERGKADSRESGYFEFPQSDTSMQRHAGQAARLLISSGFPVHVRHEVHTGPFGQSNKVSTEHPERFQRVMDMMPGVEADISARLNGSVPAAHRRRVAAGMMEIAVGRVQRNRRE